MNPTHEIAWPISDFFLYTGTGSEGWAPAPSVFLFLFSPSLPQPQNPRAAHLPRDQKRSARRVLLSDLQRPLDRADAPYRTHARRAERRSAACV